MEIYKIIGIALITAVAVIYLKSTIPDLAFAVTISGTVLILIIVFNLLTDTIDIFGKIAELSGIDNSLITTILKIVGIGYLVEFSAGTIEDFGSKNLADKLVFGGKIIILLMSLPIIESLLIVITKIMELI
jgi:stage III sporulation protein AD